MEGPGPRLDHRRLRVAHGITAVVLLAGFVFDETFVIPGLAVLVGAAAALGPRADVVARGYDTLLAPRLGPPVHFEDPATLRLAQLVATAGLSLATVFLALGAESVAWLLALVIAGESAVGALTPFDPVRLLAQRLDDRRR